MKKIKNIFWIAICLVLNSPVIVFGQVGDKQTNSGVTLPNPLSENCLTALISKLLVLVTYIGGIVAVFFIIYAGFLFVMAQGNEEGLKKAKNTLLYTVIGVAIILGANAIQIMLTGTLTSLGVTNVPSAVICNPATP
ncbi:MAG: pilin [Candidatus Paceibacterota bacterium]